MAQVLADAAAFTLLAVAFLGAITARALSGALRDRVRSHHAAWYAALAARRRGIGLGSTDENVRRAMTWPLLRGRLPPEVAADPQIAELVRWFGFAFTAAMAGFGGFVAIVALRLALAPDAPAS